MKSFTINIDSKLQNVEITVKNGAAFTRDSIAGNYAIHRFTTSEYDAKRIKQFAVKYGNDNNSNRGNWYAHCNGYSMGLFADKNRKFTINTFRPYGKTAPEKK